MPQHSTTMAAVTKAMESDPECCAEETGHTRKGRGSWTCPLLLLWKRNGGSGEISMAEPVVVTCCAAPDKDMARKTQVMESKRCRRHSKIEGRGTHSIDRMVERKKHRKETRWREAQRKHSSKWNGVHPRPFSCWRWKSQIAEFKEYKDGMSADATKNAGWLAAAQDRTMEEKKAQLSSRIGKKHAEAQSTNHKKERFCS